MTESHVIELMGLLSIYWPHWRGPLSEHETATWAQNWLRLLGDLDADVVTAALDSLAAENREHPPPPGIVRARAVALAAGDAAPDVDEAWSEVQAEIARVGWTGDLDPRRKPRFSHPAIEPAVKDIGWQALCESTNAMADRAHFLKLYGTAVGRANADALTPPAVRALADALALRDAPEDAPDPPSAEVIPLGPTGRRLLGPGMKRP